MNIDDLKKIKQSFVSELEKGEKGTGSSLPFIRHELSPHSIVDVGETFQTLVIGGSYYQKALMKRVQDNIRIIEYKQGEQPPFLTKESLMTFIEKHLYPDVRVVALNFAYPLKPTSRNGILDGTLQSGSKENTFEGLVGEVVGEEVEKYLKEKTGRDIKVSSANDTICLLLSGLIDHTWDHLSAGVVGTGLNFAIFLNKTVTVNLESAAFNAFPSSEAGLDIDARSAVPGDALYEKEISGAYLYRHFNYYAKKEGLSAPELHSTKELETLLGSENKEVARLARKILDHSAGLVAAQMAGIIEFCKRDIIFIMQGSLYWKGNKFKENVEKIVMELSPNYHASYEQVLHSDLYGAAKLVA